MTLQMTGNPSGTQTLLLTGATTGTFTNRVSHGSTIGLAVLTSPAGKTCSLNSPASVNVTGATNVTVNCTVNAYTVGGMVGGVNNVILTMSTSDVVANGQSTGPLAIGPYQFLFTVPSGSTYTIAAISPPGYSCTVQNGYGGITTANGNVANADVNCVSTGGGGGGGGGFTPGTVNGQVTNNGPDSRTILVENGANQVGVTVGSNA
ncbi:MAG: hypothetical protein HC765_16175, partial [Brachymonas sp.]|nr:hypothetical protein [Brachymonas sp.]